MTNPATLPTPDRTDAGHDGRLVHHFLTSADAEAYAAATGAERTPSADIVVPGREYDDPPALRTYAVTDV